MEVTYKREMKHNYLIIQPEDEDAVSYESRMLAGNSISGLLKFRLQYLDSKTYFYYEITSRQPLKRMLEGRCISLSELKGMMLQMIQTLERLEFYLLKESQIILEPDFIYITPEDFGVYLCMIPGRECDFPQAMSELLRYLLGKVNHQDKECVVLSYGLYQESLKDNYGIEDLLVLLMKSTSSDLDEQKEEQPEENNIEELQDASLYGSADINRKENVQKTDRRPDYGRMIGCFGIALLGCMVLYWLVGFPAMLPYGMIGVAAQIAIWYVIPGYWKTEKKVGGKAAGGKADKTTDKTKSEADKKLQWKVALEEFGEEKEEIVEKNCEPMVHYHGGCIRPNNIEAENQGDTVLLVNLDKENGLHKLIPLEQGEDIIINYFPFIIGKQEGLVDYLLAKDTVSRLHLKIDHVGEEYQVMDLNSTNGTRVNGRLLEANETVELTPGDEIFVANVRFRFI